MAAAVAAFVVLSALAACGAGGLGGAAPSVGKVQSFEDQGRRHLEPGDRKHPPYNSSPPTSGWHWELHAPNRFMQGVLEPEIQVHELEHGAVIVQFRCDNCPDLTARLWRLQRENPNVIVAPGPRDLKAAIVLTAWTKMLMLDEWDDSAARSFIEQYGGHDLGE